MSDEHVGRSEPATSDDSEAYAYQAVRTNTPVAAQGTYVPTGVALLDSLLVTVDEVTHGRAGVLQRVASYLMVGGFAAVVNLICLHVLYDLTPVPLSWQHVVPTAWYKSAHFAAAYLIATEISIFANFIPNDRITFSHLPGHQRSWWARCLRFHSTCVGGTLVTFAVSLTIHTWGNQPALVAQAIGILVGLIFNFTFHHLWTYRHVQTA